MDFNYLGTGQFNTAIGSSALYSNTTGGYNTCIGYAAYPSSSTLLNYTGIGYFTGSLSSTSNMVEIGNTSVGTIRGQVNFSTYSDARIKKNVKSNVPGLAFISKLNPVTYNLDIHAQNSIMNRADRKPEADWDGKYDIERVTQTGFIAQDVAEAAKSLNYDFNGVDLPKNPDDLYSLRYSEFVVPLVKAIQEQQQIIESERAKIKALEQKNEQLESRLKAIEEKLSK